MASLRSNHVDDTDPDEPSAEMPIA